MELRNDVLKEEPIVLQQYKQELQEELLQILDYWMKYTVDHENGGFYGSVNNDNVVDANASKGIVLMSRICWSFSAAYRYSKLPQHYEMAERAFQYIFGHFIDHEYGGVFWSVDANGKKHEGKKQIYGLAFCIYGLTEFYKVSTNKTALNTAIDLYHYIEKKSFDAERNGYIEAFARDWQPMNDLRLSPKDNNDRKTANTHLHIIEAYSNLYSVWPKRELKEKIENLLSLFNERFINKEHHHLNLFFDDEWNLRSTLQSYGHDIEAAWLLLQCAETVKHKEYIELYRQLSIPITNAAIEGLDTDGGLWYEYEPDNDQLIKEKHSWPQAEAMIGFYNAYQVNGNEKYLQYSLQSWDFVKKYILNKEKGEWYWGVNKDYSPMQKEKAGFWKCPYHNSRACMEMYKRISSAP